MAKYSKSTEAHPCTATKTVTGEHWLDAMIPEELSKSFGGEPLGIETPRGAALRVILLRDEILKHHGSNMSRIFAQYTKPSTKREATELRDWELLARFDALPKPNISQFANALAEENKALARAEQRGAGGVNPVALDRYIRRLLRDRRDAMNRAQWDGPVQPG
jgi:hypothetical protein